MTSLVLLLSLTALLLPEMTQAFRRDARAFTEKSYERQPYKRASWDTLTGEDGFQYLTLGDKRGGGDISVEDMAARLTSNGQLAKDFVSGFMDTDGDGYISAQELLPVKRR